MFEVNGWIAHHARDNFEHGCDPDTARTHVGDDLFAYSNLPDLLHALTDFVDGYTKSANMTLDACEQPGRVDLQFYETENGTAPGASEMRRWRAGKIDLWLVEYTFHVEYVTRETGALKPLMAEKGEG